MSFFSHIFSHKSKAERSKEKEYRNAAAGLFIDVDKNYSYPLIDDVKKYGHIPDVMNAKNCGYHSEYNTPLMQAIYKGNLDNIRTLLSAPAIDPNINDRSKGSTTAPGGSQNNKPIFLALSAREAWYLHIDDYRGDKNRVAIVEALIHTKGFDVNQRSRIGLTPLLFACKLLSRRDNAGVYNSALKLLEVKGINVNLQDHYGRTALHYACMWDKNTKQLPDLIKNLLDKENIALDMTDKNGWTALMYAAKQGWTTLVKALLEKGAKPDIESPSGQTAGDIARLSSMPGDDELFELLPIRHGASASMI